MKHFLNFKSTYYSIYFFVDLRKYVDFFMRLQSLFGIIGMYIDSTKQSQKRPFQKLKFFPSLLGDFQFFGQQKVRLKSTKIKETFSFHEKQTYKYTWCEYYRLWRWASIPNDFFYNIVKNSVPPLWLHHINLGAYVGCCCSLNVNMYSVQIVSYFYIWTTQNKIA